MQETRVQSLGWEDSLEKGIATYSNILAWRIPWTEEPGGLKSMGSQRVRHNGVTNTYTPFLSLTCIIFHMLRHKFGRLETKLFLTCYFENKNTCVI